MATSNDHTMPQYIVFHSMFRRLPKHSNAVPQNTTLNKLTPTELPTSIAEKFQSLSSYRHYKADNFMNSGNYLLLPFRTARSLRATYESAATCDAGMNEHPLLLKLDSCEHRGSGKFGTVYEVTCGILTEPLALKVILLPCDNDGTADTDLLKLIERETCGVYYRMVDQKVNEHIGSLKEKLLSHDHVKDGYNLSRIVIASWLLKSMEIKAMPAKIKDLCKETGICYDDNFSEIMRDINAISITIIEPSHFYKDEHIPLGDEYINLVREVLEPFPSLEDLSKLCVFYCEMAQRDVNSFIQSVLVAPEKDNGADIFYQTPHLDINFPLIAWIEVNGSTERSTLYLLSKYLPNKMEYYLQYFNREADEKSQQWFMDRYVMAKTMSFLLSQLKAIHRVHCVHRDLRPDNLPGYYVEWRFRFEGKFYRQYGFDCCLNDYSIMRVSEPAEPATAESASRFNQADVHYMAPEVWRGEIHLNSDIYSAGALYQTMLMVHSQPNKNNNPEQLKLLYPEEMMIIEKMRHEQGNMRPNAELVHKEINQLTSELGFKFFVDVDSFEIFRLRVKEFGQVGLTD